MNFNWRAVQTCIERSNTEDGTNRKVNPKKDQTKETCLEKCVLK